MEVRVGTAELFDFLIGAGALGGRFSDAVDIAVSFVKEKKIDSEVQISAETEKTFVWRCHVLCSKSNKNGNIIDARKRDFDQTRSHFWQVSGN